MFIPIAIPPAKLYNGVWLDQFRVQLDALLEEDVVMYRRPRDTTLFALVCVLMGGIPLWADDSSLVITNITATASSSYAEDKGPDKTVDGSGLDEMDRHSTNTTDMWLSGQDPMPWIQFEFDKIYQLHQMWVWNHNQLIERFIGLGTKDVVVEYSTDGVVWAALEGTTQFSQATSSADYAANTIIEFEGVAAKYVKITISTNYGVMPQYGLSEVRFFYFIPVQAKKPGPGDASIDVLRDTRLSWISGEFAAKHHVYLGASFEDVNSTDPTALVSQGQTEPNYTPDAVFEFGQTYYWRVDEVNGAPDYTVFRGDVWSFTIEPYSIPIEAVTATASSSHADNMGPGNTIDGVGLNELDQHSTEATEMWLSGIGDPTPSIQYEFDKPYKLHELWVWNSNQLVESFVGVGAKDVTIESSLDGVEWMALEDAPQVAQASGTADYTANTIVDFDGAQAKFVKITIHAGYGILPQYSLSEVRFYYIPTYPTEPQPANGGSTEGVDIVLSWRAGREAALHQVYLGGDAENLILVSETNENSYTARNLNYDTGYYWQVIEVNEAAPPSSYAGDVWNFVTPAFAIVDDFEQYDDNCKRIYFAWEDGLGHFGGEDIDDCEVAPFNGNGGGAVAGHNLAPFAEKTIVNVGSKQSMPLMYDNTHGQSAATLTLTGQDWTASGIQTLTLFFYGQPGNSGQLYVEINNAKMAYDGDATDITSEQWQAWNIDLASLDGLENVTTLTIGVEGDSAVGMLYVDDIRLYP